MLPNSASLPTYEIPIFSSVHYKRNNITLSDTVLTEVLENITVVLGVELWVSSADRAKALSVGAKGKSLHLHHRAVDFSIPGLTLAVAHEQIAAKAESIFIPGQMYEFIYHGPYTSTMGSHLHIGRHLRAGSEVRVIKEGITKKAGKKHGGEGPGQYHRVRTIFLPGA